MYAADLSNDIKWIRPSWFRFGVFAPLIICTFAIAFDGNMASVGTPAPMILKNEDNAAYITTDPALADAAFYTVPDTTSIVEIR